MRSDLIKAYLIKYARQDLADLYSGNMQCQVIVSPIGGKRDGKGFTNEIEAWYPFVINSDETNDKKIVYDFEKHVMGIGTTGWNWKDKQTHWVAFDFDSLVNHKQGLSDKDLKEIAEKLNQIDWVTIRKSTGGIGLHIYVQLDPVVPTANHSEHAALSRAILHKLTGLTGVPFKDKVDICGGNMWIWHEKQAHHNGLLLIKKGEPLTHIPNWREHIEVINRNPSKKKYDTIAQAKSNVALDSGHQELVDFLESSAATWWWDNDKHLMVCHTSDLKKAHDQLNLKGIFETDSSGTTAQNCFCFPLRDGGWTVRRFSKGCSEHNLWDNDSSGWTRAYFNVDTDLQTAARVFGGLEHPTGGFIFKTTHEACKALSAIGISVQLDKATSLNEAKLKEHKDGRLLFEIPDPENRLSSVLDGWLYEKKVWKKLFNKTRAKIMGQEIDQFDALLRHIVSQSNREDGWVLQTEGQWVFENLTHVKLALSSMGYKSNEINEILGTSILKNWKIVSVPFAPEYPGDRQWNMNSVQLRYQPSTFVPDDLSIDCPTWNMILQHIGQSLDSAVNLNVWCKENGIDTGAKYLALWIASMFQYPNEPLPYLFFYSKEQNTGKSTFHECLGKLLVNGYVDAENALTTGFNAEIQSSVLCYVEEVDLGKDKTALAKMKKWVTSPTISVHEKFKTPYACANSCHFIHCANDFDACPVFVGDTRVVVAKIETLKKVMPSRDFFGALAKEAPSFMSYILNINIPDSKERLYVPVIVTEDKTTLEEFNKSPLEDYVSTAINFRSGEMIKFSEFFEAFASWNSDNSDYYTKHRVSKELAPLIRIGASRRDNQKYLINVSFTEGEQGEPLIIQGGKIS